MTANQTTRETLTSELIEILSDLFDIDPEQVDLDTSPDSVEAWDSIGHMRLISSIEEKYQISITPEDQIEMLNVDLVISFLTDKLTT